MQSHLQTTFENTPLSAKKCHSALDVKQTFGGQSNNPWCTSCGLIPETESHLLQSPEIVPKLGYIQGRAFSLDENFVYGSIEQQQMIVKIYSAINNTYMFSCYYTDKGLWKQTGIVNHVQLSFSSLDIYVGMNICTYTYVAIQQAALR